MLLYFQSDPAQQATQISQVACVTPITQRNPMRNLRYHRGPSMQHPTCDGASKTQCRPRLTNQRRCPFWRDSWPAVFEKECAHWLASLRLNRKKTYPGPEHNQSKGTCTAQSPNDSCRWPDLPQMGHSDGGLSNCVSEF